MTLLALPHPAACGVHRPATVLGPSRCTCQDLMESHRVAVISDVYYAGFHTHCGLTTRWKSTRPVIGPPSVTYRLEGRRQH